MFFCWRETWSLALREERRLRVFKNRVLRKIFGLKRNEVTGENRRLPDEERNDLYSHQMLFERSNEEECELWWMWFVSRRGKVHAGLWWGDVTDEDYFEDVDGITQWKHADGMFILKQIFKKWDGELLTGVIWLRIKAGVGSCECCDEHLCSTKCGEFLE